MANNAVVLPVTTGGDQDETVPHGNKIFDNAIPPPPRAFFNQFSAITVFFCLSPIIMVSMFPVAGQVSPYIYLMVILSNAFFLITFLAFSNRMEHVIGVFYQLEFAIFGCMLFFMALEIIQYYPQFERVPLIYWYYYFLPFVGIYRALLAKRIYKWIRECKKGKLALTVFPAVNFQN